LNMPIYFFPTLNVSDFIHPEQSIQTVERYVELLHKHELTGNVDFTAITADMFAEKAPEIFEKIKDFGLSAGFHGSNRPLTSVARMRDMDWEQAVKAIVDMDTHRIDPKTGKIDKTRRGGFETLRKYFGYSPPSVGRTIHVAYLQAHRILGAKMFVGLTDHVGGESNLAWYMGMLSRPESVFITPGIILWSSIPHRQRAYVYDAAPLRETRPPHPTEVLSVFLDILPRDKPNFISLTMHEFDFYMAGRWTNLESPFRPEEHQEAIWKTLDETFAFLKKNKDFRVISYNVFLSDVVIDDTEKTLTQEQIDAAARYIVRYMSHWTGHGRCIATPNYIDLKGDYLSLAEAFKALVYVLDYYHKEKNLPKSVKIEYIDGPLDVPRPPGGIVKPQVQRGYGTSILVDGEKIIEAASRIASENLTRIPANVKIEGLAQPVNPAEFLYMMAQEETIIKNKGRPAPAIYAEAHLLPKQAIGNHTRSFTVSEKPTWYALLQLWTQKPARLKKNE